MYVVCLLFYAIGGNVVILYVTFSGLASLIGRAIVLCSVFAGV